MISVIVLNWNGRRFLKECFDSLLVQTSGVYELIMVDNGSSDGSLEFMSRNFPQVKVLSLRRNIGFCRAMNMAIKTVKGDFIALFNNDVVVDKNWLTVMNNTLVNHPQVGICASKVLFYKEPNKINSAGDVLSITGEAHNRGFGQQANGKFNLKEEVFSASAAACIYRRKMLEEVGLFDEDFFNTYEDVDLGFRAHSKGWRCLYVPEAVVYHHWLGTIGYYSPMNIFYISKNNLNILVKNMPFELIKKHALIILKRQLKISLNMALGGSYAAFVRGRLRYLWELPLMLKKRNLISAESKVGTKELENLFIGA